MSMRLGCVCTVAVVCALGVVSGFAPAGAAQAAEGAFSVPSEVFAGEPRGRYQTGTFEAMWVSETLDDPSTADPHDKRKLMVQVWYPATPPKHPRRAPYAISPHLYGEDNGWVHEFAHVRTRSVLDAPAAASPERLPVLIYNHGGNRPSFSATFQTEFLASHGYVVVAIGHSGSNKIQRFPDGASYTNDGVSLAIQSPPGEKRAWRESADYRYEIGRAHV